MIQSHAGALGADVLFGGWASALPHEAQRGAPSWERPGHRHEAAAQAGGSDRTWPPWPTSWVGEGRGPRVLAPEHTLSRSQGARVTEGTSRPVAVGGGGGKRLSKVTQGHQPGHSRGSLVEIKGRHRDRRQSWGRGLTSGA